MHTGNSKGSGQTAYAKADDGSGNDNETAGGDNTVSWAQQEEEQQQQEIEQGKVDDDDDDVLDTKALSIAIDAEPATPIDDNDDEEAEEVKPRRVTIGQRKEKESKKGLSLNIIDADIVFEHKRMLTFNLIIHSIVFLLLIFAAAGYSPTESGIRAFHWSYGRKVRYYNSEFNGITRKTKTTRRTWYGLSGLYEEREVHLRKEIKNNGGFEVKKIDDSEDTYKYYEEDCPLSQCDNCEDGGQIVFDAVVTSVVFTFLCAVLQLFSFSMKQKQYWAQAAALPFSVLSMCLAYSAVGVFVRDCYYPSNDEDDTQQFGPGFALTIASAILLTFTIGIQILDLLLPNKLE